MKNQLSSNKRVFSLILVALSILVAIWFRKGLMMGGGEVGIPFYNMERLYEVTSKVWLDIILGFPAPQVLASSPFYFIMAWFEIAGVPGFVLQALTFWALLVTGSCSVYLLTEKTRGFASTKWASLLSALFYVLNPFSMTIVWHRFQIAFMFFYALLPLSLLLVVEGLDQKRYVYGFFIGLVSAIMSYSFAETPFIETFWLVVISYFVYYSMTNLRKRYEFFFALKFLSVTFVAWVLLNSWWLLPLIGTGPNILQTFTSSSSNLATLLSISQHAGPLYTLRLVDWYYTYVETAWGSVFSSTLFELIASSIPLIAFSTLLLRKKSKLIIYFTVLALILSFLTKGSSPPFGDIFVWIFERIPYLQLFRNPVEKIGIALPLAFSPLFGIGLVSLYLRIRQWMAKSFGFRSRELSNAMGPIAVAVIFLVIFSNMGLYVWPMWTGRVFTSPYTPANDPNIGYYVAVPKYYSNARTWLSSDKGIYRLIVLPITGAGITYTWKYGYSGVEISNQLLGKDAVSLGEGLAYTDNIILSLDKLLLTTGDFWKVMAILNAKYLVIRSDINYSLPYRDMTDPSVLITALNHTVQPSISKGLVVQNSTSVVSLLPGSRNESLISWVWVNGSLPHTLEFSNGGKQSNYSISMNGTSSFYPQGNYSLLGFYYYIPSNLQKWVNARYLLMWVKSNVAGKLYIELDDTTGKGMAWDGRTQEQYQILPNESGSWKLFVLPLDFPSYGSVDLSKIYRILVAIVTPKSSGVELKLGGLFIDKGHVVPQKYISHDITFGSLSFYKIDEAHFVERIYAVTNLRVVEDINGFFSLLQSENYDPRNTVVFLRNQLQASNIADLVLINGSSWKIPPQIAFKKLDSTTYIVNITNARGPFFLVFSETYYPDWKAYYGNVDWLSSFFSKPIAEQYHFVANGYANAWLINKTGSYTITLYFQPQSLSTLGSIASISALALGLIIVAYTKRGDIIKLAESLKRSLT